MVSKKEKNYIHVIDTKKQMIKAMSNDEFCIWISMQISDGFTDWQRYEFAPNAGVAFLMVQSHLPDEPPECWKH